MRRQGLDTLRAVSTALSMVLLFSSLLDTAPALAALPPAGLYDDPDGVIVELNSERWQRFLTATRARYQALAEKAEVLQWQLTDDCSEVRLGLGERRECLRTDVFARAAMERDGMALDEYASVLHAAVVADGFGRASPSQRGQFERLRAEWWPTRLTAEQ